MNKYIILILSILLFNGIPLLAEPFKVPPIIPNEKGTIVTEYKDGGLRWKADWKTDIYIENGETKFKLVIKAKGLTSPFRKDMELAPDAPQVHCLAFVSERRISPDHEQPVKA